MPSEPFTCPLCFDTTPGNARVRRAARRLHARRHRVPVTALDPLPPEQPPPDLVIPPAPKNRARAR